jgi:hypothetical protein
MYNFTLYAYFYFDYDISRKEQMQHKIMCSAE